MSADFDEILDALHALWTPALAPVEVRESGEIAYEPASYLQVGSTGPDPGEGVETLLQRAGLGREPTRIVRVPCLAWAGSGDPDVRALRLAAKVIYGAAGAALRTPSGRNLGGLVDTADVASSTYRHYLFPGRGAGAGIGFVVEVKAL